MNLGYSTHILSIGAFQYLAQLNMHPKHVVNGIVGGEFVRYIRTTRGEIDFSKNVSIIESGSA